jgi:flagellar hook-basal body complex protein FliE
MGVLLVTAAMLCVSGCASDSHAAKGAAQGGGTGALAGAVGAAATALIFGGNVGEAAARGAVYGGASGAVVGGISGAERDKQVAAQERAEYERRVQEFRDEIGTDAFNGFVALTECKHEVALANAREAQKSSNRDFALAGLWVEVLTEADRQQTDAATALLPAIVEQDREISDTTVAQARLDTALGEIGEIRNRYELAPSCFDQ